jgi:hypothetical protein
MTFSLVLDIVIAVLLVITIGYAMVLNRRLTGLRKDKAQLEKLAASFGEATLRAGQGTLVLRSTTGALQECIDKAEVLRDDLQFLLDRGTSAADRLEAVVRSSRDRSLPDTELPSKDAGKSAVAGGAGTDAGTKDGAAKTSAERQLLRALQSPC